MDLKKFVFALALTMGVTQVYSQSFKAVEDASVLKNYPSKNYGGSSKLEVDGSPVAESFLKFNVSGLSAPVSKAILKLYVTNGSADGPSVYGTSSDWKELSINYGNRPARGSKLAGIGSVSAKKFVEYDVSAFVKGNGVFSFNLAGSHSDGTDFASRSATNPPALIITTGSVTEPPEEPEVPTIPEMTFTSIGSTSQTIHGDSYGVQSALKEWSIAKSQFGKVYRFEVRQGENRANGSDPDSRDRSELKHQVDYTPGTELWASYSFMIEKGDLILDDDANISQWHPGISASPPVAIQLYEEKLRIRTRHGSQSNQITTNRHISSSPIERGRWYSLVHRVRFDAYGNAMLQMWLDGKMIVDISNVSIGFTDSTRNYWKFGIYRSTHPNTLSTRYANMEVGTKSLLHRVTTPLSIAP